MLLLRDRASRPDAARSPTRDPEPAVRQASRLLCRSCRTPISDRDAIFSPGAGPPVQVFTNPHGRVFPVLTLKHAESLVFVGPPSLEYTWFSGYAWQVALCARCVNHLGWRFEAAAGGTPPIFFGLLRAELVEEEAEGNLGPRMP
jgi:hypothetical protein